MSVAECAAVTPLEDVLRESIIAYLEGAVSTYPTVHYLSLLCLREGLEDGSLDPGTAMAHLEATDLL
jgi:hypothetical protein